MNQQVAKRGGLKYIPLSINPGPDYRTSPSAPVPKLTITESDPEYNPMLGNQSNEVKPYDYKDVRGTEYDKQINPQAQIHFEEQSIKPIESNVNGVIASQ